MNRIGAWVAACLILVACTDSTPQVRAGDIAVESGWLRATPPGASVGVGYVTLRNTGDVDDRLIGITGAAANRIEIHVMKDVDGVMQMRRMADGLAVPADSIVMLAPGGYHLMLLGLKMPLVAGDQMVMKLAFEKGKGVDVAFEVRAADFRDDEHSHH